jgi:hypothetical protein
VRDCHRLSLDQSPSGSRDDVDKSVEDRLPVGSKSLVEFHTLNRKLRFSRWKENKKRGPDLLLGDHDFQIAGVFAPVMIPAAQNTKYVEPGRGGA